MLHGCPSSNSSLNLPLRYGVIFFIINIHDMLAVLIILLLSALSACIVLPMAQTINSGCHLLAVKKLMGNNTQ